MVNKHNNWPKHTFQWVILALIIFFVSGLAAFLFKTDPANAETYCPMGGLQAFVTYIVRGSLPCSMTTVQIMMGLALAVAVILFSKLFCGYICPVGTIEDLLIKVRKPLNIKGIEIKNSVADKVLRIIKYILLFWIFLMTATASELFCKNLDPYYAVATGFKGEITLWMSIVTIILVILGGLFINRFWCKYICPLGAASNTFKFWLPLVIVFAIYAILNVLGLHINWIVLLAVVCILGYCLEIFCGKPKYQILHVIKDNDKCVNCGLCSKKCPYSIDVANCDSIVRNVDCTLCGECMSACNKDALHIGVCTKSSCRHTSLLPAIIALVLLIAAVLVGRSIELPTIDENWGIEEGVNYQTVKMTGLKTVKCYGSSMAFKARMEKIHGVHGVKTYVGSHTVAIKYNPAEVTEEKIKQEVFVPTHFRIWSPDPKKLDSLKIVTIGVEKMYDKMDLNYLGLQMRTTGKSIFGLESEYDCPVRVRVYMSPDENLNEAWFKEIVNKKVLQMPVHGGGVKETPVDLEYVKMFEGVSYISIKDYLWKMFDAWSAEFNGKYTENGEEKVEKRVKHYEGQPQFIYEIADQNYEKPIVARGLPYLGNHLSAHEGIIGAYLTLNKDLVPCLQVRFAAPMTADEVWKLMTMDKWTVTYKDGPKVEDARLKFEKEGICYPYEPVPVEAENK